MQVPPEYHGREQSYLKHLFLDGYLDQWAHKLGSASRSGRRTRLWYVDAFAGPWNQRHPDMRDTSIAIGLEALEAAAKTWRGRGYVVELGAIFVEIEKDAFTRLEGYLRSRATEVKLLSLRGKFGDHVETISQHLGQDAAFIFVDPKGWKGAAMRFIAPLVAGRAPRDVLVNVMYDHMNRQKDRAVPYIRAEMQDFFGLDGEELPENLTEDQLLDRYRLQLKKQCGLAHAAHLAVPHPTMNRTKFHLVVGGKDKAVVRVFRDVEKKILGKAAAIVRDDAERRRQEARTGQLQLFSTPPASDRAYERLHQRDIELAAKDVERLLARSARRFGDIWPTVLAERHLTFRDLAQIVWNMHEDGRVFMQNLGEYERSVKEEHVLQMSRPAQVRDTRSNDAPEGCDDADADINRFSS